MKPLKLVFDANPMAYSKKSGIGYYTQNLIISLAEQYPQEVELIGYYFNFLGRKNPHLPQYPNLSYRPIRWFPGTGVYYLRRLGINPPLKGFVSDKPDALFFPNFLTLPYSLSVPTVLTIHDVAYLERPEYIHPRDRKILREYVPLSIDQADMVMTVSQFTRDKVQTYYNVEKQHIGLTPVAPPDPIPATENPIDKSYILFVGNIEPRKNIHGLLNAYSLLSQELRERYRLVLAGNMNHPEIAQHIHDLQEQGYDIQITGYISDQEKANLYTHCSLFVLPSYYEGFGMPILEAMSYGAPTLVSDLEVFREITFGKSHFCKPSSAEDIADNITCIVTDKEYSQHLREQGYWVVDQYQWSQIAQDFFQSIQRIIH